MIRKLYPEGKEKAFNITYDDGILQDIRFVELLNRYGIKGTFNLNSGLMKKEFEWIHPCGMVIKRLPENIAVDLYKGHEVASHSFSHPYMYQLSREEILQELSRDKENLQELFGRRIDGFAAPFDYYSDLIEECVRKCGFAYARVPEVSHNYAPGENFYRWKAGIFHLDPDLSSYVDYFLTTNEELALCQIVGHSYDLDTEHMWEKMEEILRKISDDGQVIAMTNIELIRYIRAMGQADVMERYIQNNSEVSLWFEINGKTVEVRPGERTVY